MKNTTNITIDDVFATVANDTTNAKIITPDNPESICSRSYQVVDDVIVIEDPWGEND